MKAKYTISFILGITVLFYLFSGISAVNNNTETININPPQTNNGDNFILGAFQDGYDIVFNNYADTLGFNIWHMYDGSRKWGGRTYPDGWTHPVFAPADSLFADRNNYIGQVEDIMDVINQHNKKALLMRPKVEWLCFGQRSDYQCEDVSGDLWFYSFNTRETGEPTTDSGQGVIHCRTGDGPNHDSPGIVVKNLRANAEQCNRTGEFHGDSECDWLIKPKIRIDKNWAENPANFNTPVCSLKIINQAGNVIKEVIIKGHSFLVDINNTYNGQYIEEFNLISGDDTLKVHGAWGNLWMYSARGYNNDPGADIQVYWYGNCDMWIDCVRVDNDVADKLFKHYYDDPNHPEREWLKWEAQDIACYLNGAASYNFYIELFEFNNIPCMAYVTHKLDSIAYAGCGKHISLTCIPIPTFYSAHVPWTNRRTVWNAAHFRDNFINKVGISEFLLGFYPFNSSYHYPETYPYNTWSKIPNTLPRYDTIGTLAAAVSPSAYEDWLQNYLDEKPYTFDNGYSGGFRSPCEEDPGGLRYTFQFGDEVSKLTGKPFLFNPQVHIWYLGAPAPNEPEGAQPREITGEVQREPTNEEMDMQVNVALSYGARGFIYFQYLSGQNNPGDTFYDRGIMEPWTAQTGLVPRINNIYNQPKFENLKAISKRIKKWEPYIMSFDNTNRHSYIYRLEDERNTLLDNSYFRSIAAGKNSYPPNNCNEWLSPGEPVPPPEEGISYDCKQYTYLQAATFKQSSADPSYPFFMIVNRRCSPVNGSYENGRRKIKILFDVSHPEINGYDNWNIRDLGQSGAPICTTFVRSAGQWVNLDWFEPGEGKLYKLEPVFPNGGELAGDETIPSGSYTILDTIFTNGYDLTIEGGAHLYFTDTSTIVVDGGKFTAGTVSEGQPNIFITAASGNTFHGLNFTGGAEVKIYKSSFSGLAIA